MSSLECLDAWYNEKLEKGSKQMDGWFWIDFEQIDASSPGFSTLMIGWLDTNKVPSSPAPGPSNRITEGFEFLNIKIYLF
jgi:hypothetical protein